MGPHERWTALLDILGRDGRLDVADAAAELSVSAATIRRDLDHLSGRQLLTRTRGGAAPASIAYDLPLRYKSGRNAAAKARIGSAAADLIPVGSVLAINGGTTTSEVARALVTAANGSSNGSAPPEDPSDDGAPGGLAYTVVTNALNIANDLAVRRTIKLVVTGGVARPNSYELIGPLAEPGLAKLHLDFVVLGVDGVDTRIGATADHEGEAAVTTAMVAQASTVLVVADSSKLGRRSFARICPVDDIDILVTDTDAPAERVAEFADAGVRVIQV
ncbi:DeoR/GlpR family DNA-binding transcription regulator [Nakamurella aerolata]|uniref:DeoR/GlpR transcriptional regulator n=1 Tax=Nakamurella aerolata TaxID=1656892 RepID=A0A848ZZL1_9ACTN|nr:DeoR/GlpR family DNA-binding transcription regulator [Nakamurella aerolata]NNG34254.1 DeoR/GlpR transcriptional regulator [Nakamurella aerolata]